MIMDTQKKSAAKLRAEVYEYLLWSGFQMTDAQKNGLSTILKSVYEHRVVESRKVDDAPMRHEIVCPKCQGVKVMVGKQFKNYKKRIKMAGGIVGE